MRRASWLAPGVLVLAALAPPARADGMRCPEGGLVSTGDAREQVLRKCGEPTDRKVTTSVPCRRGRCAVDLEEWRYDFGPYQFVRLLTFLNGKLERITVLDYGGR